MTLLPRSDRATYTPALQPDYAATVSRNPAEIRDGNVPAELSLQDFNFLRSDSKLLFYPTVLYSAGHNPEAEPPAMVSGRDRDTTTLIGDSGGYQIKMGTLNWREDRTRRAILNFLETYADYSMTLDYPVNDTKASVPDQGHFNDCLSKTVTNLEFFGKHRKDQTKWINVIQGRNNKEIKTWIKRVEWFPSQGWAVGGRWTLDPANLLELLITLRDTKLLEQREVFHQFGKGRIALACFYTDVQQAMRETGIDIAITYDTSSPFRMTGEFKTQFTAPIFTTKRCELQAGRVFDRRDYVGNSRRFPFDSAIGQRIALGDICVRDDVHQDTTWDELSHVMVKHHNLDAYRRALDAAHLISDLADLDAQNHLPVWLMMARQTAREVFKVESPMTKIDFLRRNLKEIKFSSLTQENGVKESV